MFLKTGENVRVYPMAKLIGNIAIGDNVIIDDFVFINASEKTFKIGSYVHISSFTSIVGGGECIIDDFSGISGGVRIYTSNEDYFGSCLTNPTVPYPWRKKINDKVHVGKHVLIGANSVIIPGVTIGEGAIVGALSLVKDNLEPWTIYAGSPAKPIKKRLKEDILRLEKDFLVHEQARNIGKQTDFRTTNKIWDS